MERLKLKGMPVATTRVYLRQTPQQRVIALISYQTCVACIINGEGYVTDRKYSSTSSRHVHKFVSIHPVISWFNLLDTLSTKNESELKEIFRRIEANQDII